MSISHIIAKIKRENTEHKTIDRNKQIAEYYFVVFMGGGIDK